MQDWMASAAVQYGERTAWVDGEQSLTFAEMNRRVAAVAARMDDLGVRLGDRVGIVLPNGLPYLTLIHAAGRVGAEVVLQNARLTDHERAWQVGHAGCSWVIDEAALERDFSRLDSNPNPRWANVEIDLDHTAAILFTSGTSGKPKAAQLTLGNFYASANASAERLGVQPDDRWLLCLPMYHVGGLSILYRSVFQGTTVVLPPDNSLESIMHALNTQAITHVSVVPTQLYRMIQAGFIPSRHLRRILLGGAAASPDLLKMAAERNIPVATTYGLTEACSQVATMPPEQARRKQGSVGKPLQGTTIRIVDEAGNDQPVGEYGEIVVSGATVMKGYLGLPETGGTIHTGDIGYLDADGDLWVVQRRSDLIVSGGENVYPAEVENVLRQHPAVEDVCVVGVMSEEWGQQVAVALVLKQGKALTTDELTTFARAHLAGYKVPRRVLMLESLPMTASGKIERKSVAALFVKT